MIKNVYINQSPVNCITIDGDSFDQWNIWLENCWLENAGYCGVRVDCKDHDITALQILNDSFGFGDIGVNFQRTTPSGGKVDWCWIRGNKFATVDKVAVLIWKVCEHILVEGNICHTCGNEAANTYHTIRVGNGNVAADKCSWISILNNIIDGNAKPKYGISLEDSSDRILVMGNIVEGCATAPYNAEVGVTNVLHVDNIEV